jgi:hypothetical protein
MSEDPHLLIQWREIQFFQIYKKGGLLKETYQIN